MPKRQQAIIWAKCGLVYWSIYASLCFNELTHWGRDKMAAFYPDDIFKWVFLNEDVWISIKISLKFVPKDPINNFPSLVQIMAWCRSGDKPLSEPMMVSLLKHICVTQPQWVKRRLTGLQQNIAQTLDNCNILVYMQIFVVIRYMKICIGNVFWLNSNPTEFFVSLLDLILKMLKTDTDHSIFAIWEPFY